MGKIDPNPSMKSLAISTDYSDKLTSMKISSACLVSLAILKADLFTIFVLLSLSEIAIAIYSRIRTDLYSSSIILSAQLLSLCDLA